MIACDTSSFAALLGGASGADVDHLAAALRDGTLALPPAALAEILSNPGTHAAARTLIHGVCVLDILPSYWIRVAESRSKLIQKRLKARFADALIAQSCIDADVALITRDSDFRHFATHCGLKLA
jgi:predicted nucleic acid-binding protein